MLLFSSAFEFDEIAFDSTAADGLPDAEGHAAGVGDPNAVGARHPAAAGTAAEKWAAAHGPFHKTFSYAERKNGSCIEIFQFLCPAIEIFTDFFDAELKMSKNSPIQLITEMIMHAFNKRGFFTVPCRPGFFVRPYPVAVRR